MRTEKQEPLAEGMESHAMHRFLDGSDARSHWGCTQQQGCDPQPPMLGSSPTFTSSIDSTGAVCTLRHRCCQVQLVWRAGSVSCAQLLLSAPCFH